MAEKTLEELSQKMRGIDIAFLTTLTEDGAPATRPMSNNGQVDYDGESYYFTTDDSRMVSDIEEDSLVTLAFRGEHFYMTVSGTAEINREQSAFKEHWTPDLDKWFSEGVETDGLVLIQISADRIKYWDGMEEGELLVDDSEDDSED